VTDLATGRVLDGFDLSAWELSWQPNNNVKLPNVNRTPLIRRGLHAMTIAP
jgi:hypothetical protein